MIVILPIIVSNKSKRFFFFCFPIFQILILLPGATIFQFGDGQKRKKSNFVWIGQINFFKAYNLICLVISGLKRFRELTLRSFYLAYKKAVIKTSFQHSIVFFMDFLYITQLKTPKQALFIKNSRNYWIQS